MSNPPAVADLPLADLSLAEIDELFSSFHRTGVAPHVAYAVVRRGQILHAAESVAGRDTAVTVEAGAPADAVFRIASMTKSFTAATVLLLRDEGGLVLDEPVATYVPEAAGIVPPTADAPALTLRMLLTMSAGFPSDDPWADRQESMASDEFAALLTGGPRHSAPPGTRFEYSNLAYAIIGRAIANVSGAPFHDVVRSRLIDPLGLTSTRFADDEIDPRRLVTGHRRHGDTWEPLPFDRPGAFSAIGGLYSSITDLARWIGGLGDAFPARDGADDHPLSRASRREMQQAHRHVGVTVVQPGPPTITRAGGYGFGLVVEHDSRWGTIVNHSGGYPGFGTNMRWHPATGFGVVALGNGTYVSTRTPAAAALDLVLGQVLGPDGATTSGIDPWPETLAMQDEVERLLVDWDDVLADRLFAPNVDLDVPRQRRRAEISEIVAPLGAVRRERASSVSGAHRMWSLRGDGGRVQVEIWLTPEPTPRLHTLKVTTLAGDT